ncbi:MAG: hypothetical protein HUU12_10485 [Anaerolineales bacterium]|nr:hypothetical protein [Anaerolineales bacterium]NUQ59790.1 hypothetical protein [Anaerolineales bacterium]
MSNGNIHVFKNARLIVVKTNPLEDLRSLADRKNIEYVMQGGRFVASSLANRTEFQRS